MAAPASDVRVSVCGVEFRVRREALLRYPNSKLAQQVQALPDNAAQALSVEADPALFPYVVQFLTYGAPVLVDASITSRVRAHREFTHLGFELSKDDIHIDMPEDEALQSLADGCAVALVAKADPFKGKTVVEFEPILTEACAVKGPEVAKVRHLAYTSYFAGLVQLELQTLLPHYRAHAAFDGICQGPSGLLGLLKRSASTLQGKGANPPHPSTTGKMGLVTVTLLPREALFAEGFDGSPKRKRDAGAGLEAGSPTMSLSGIKRSRM
ncbi:unnamed protein product [Vitrella brassicaformis CCMP3155]|uniref:Potassium channel tetramerisation-type BTB domain-containing protein n=1 Tax=Vitrella brassicaformis (strain CCMP3155) TaxID=1169540 RepID=A0A0G4G9S0_VITBC|nr:unnamed protein product [Vitrella brassicaformis CCMP3155]|mmetsp:Transcript_42359/g.105741  ORF Transcript_42359/g.105741 Transcript_42359/m.105741 type:complete len:268 (-) Transcript_42359:342-1145(-)|eukprot:CEM25268.1 unnamed protein product [Vitrella brassicaformis CCMP3155]